MADQLTIDQFRELFLQLTNGWTWEVEGFLDKQGRVHPIDSDTKVLSTVFERLASPVIRSIAKRFDYRVELANQTTYPDFTLTQIDTAHRIAIDIKSTYVSRQMVLTLGGYNSFLRNDTKNILYPYSSYSGHWIVGFIYNQLDPHEEYDLESIPKATEISCPYSMETLFIREKHEISGLRAGSGNTKNIGSVKLTRPDDFATASGPFSRFERAKEACDHFWRNYETYRAHISTTSNLTSHPDFQRFGVVS